MPDPARQHNPPTHTNLPPKGTLLGFDFGLARIGVAVGELETRLAHALTTVHQQSNAARFEAISRLVAQWHPHGLVVGLPSHADGKAHELTSRCQRFAHQLHGRLALPVFLVDERFTSRAADTLLRETDVSGWKARKNAMDETAAQLILQQFLDTLNHATP